MEKKDPKDFSSLSVEGLQLCHWGRGTGIKLCVWGAGSLKKEDMQNTYLYVKVVCVCIRSSRWGLLLMFVC